MRLIIVMEWNSKTPLEWDLENLAMYDSRTFEIPTSLEFSSHEIDEVKESGRIYSSVFGSGSDLWHGSTSQNSFSASADSSVKEGLQSLSAVDVFPKDVSKKEEFWGVDKNGNFPSMGACLGSGVPMTGLKLGRQTSFEDMCAGSPAKSTSSSVDPSSSCPTTKRSRQSHQRMQIQRCQVEGCNLDLVSAKGYHRRHKICESHSKSPRVTVAGVECRFCQQCSRFHDLSEFDDKKRSCRRRLSDHNARRRRPQPEATQFNSTQPYDQRPRMNFLLNRVPIPAANRTWGTDCHLTRTLASDSRIIPAEVGQNALSSFEGITPRARTLYSDASAITSTLDVAPELRHAPSLLSSNSWASNEREPASLEQLVHGNHIALAQPVGHSNLQNWAASSTEYVRVEQTPTGSCTHLLDFNSTGSTQFQHRQSFNTAHESDCFYSNQIN